VYAYFWFQTGPRREQHRRSIIAILTGTIAALLVNRTIAAIIPLRLRPMYAPGIPHHPYSFPITYYLENWNSLPSDNATYFFALAFGLAHLLPRYTVPNMLYPVVWICLPRLYLGEHYLSDLVAGAGIGIVIVWAAIRSRWFRYDYASRVLSLMDAQRGMFYAFAFLIYFEMGSLFSDIRSIGQQVIHIGRMTKSLPGPVSLLIAGALIAIGLTAGFAVARAFRARTQQADEADDPNRSRMNHRRSGSIQPLCRRPV